MARTGLKDSQGRAVHQGERGGLYVMVDGSRRYLPPDEQKRLGRSLKNSGKFDDPITLNERNKKKDGILLDKKWYDAKSLEEWTRAKKTVPHSRAKLDENQLRAIARAKNIRDGHEGWEPAYRMFSPRKKLARVVIDSAGAFEQWLTKVLKSEFAGFETYGNKIRLPDLEIAGYVIHAEGSYNERKTVRRIAIQDTIQFVWNEHIRRRNPDDFSNKHQHAVFLRYGRDDTDEESERYADWDRDHEGWDEHFHELHPAKRRAAMRTMKGWPCGLSEILLETFFSWNFEDPEMEDLDFLNTVCRRDRNL